MNLLLLLLLLMANVPSQTRGHEIERRRCALVRWNVLIMILIMIESPALELRFDHIEGLLGPGNRLDQTVKGRCPAGCLRAVSYELRG